MSIVTMVYGTYNISPVPFLALTRQLQTKADGTIIGCLFNARLDGTIYCPTGGFPAVIAKQQDLRQAFLTHGLLFKVMCDSTELIKAYPRIAGPIDFQETSDNWVFSTKYSVDLQWDDELVLNEASGLVPPYISDTQESWSVEFVEDKAKYEFTLPGSITDANPYQVRITHAISAVGKKHYTSGTLDKEAWEQAREYIVPRLGYNGSYLGASGVLNISSGNFTAFNHVRQNVVDISAGSYSVTENWIAINPSGSGVAGRALEDFTVDVRKGIESDITTVSIQGSIQGLETRSYGTNPGDFTISETKYAAASGYWAAINTTRIYPRAQLFAGSGLTRPINTTPASRVVGHNPVNGLITYSYEYNDRPSNCITGAITESIMVTDNNPTDVFAEIGIPGRSAGPILQDMGTITSAKREVSIEAIMAPATGCASVSGLFINNPRTQVATIINLFSGDLTSTHTQVFKHADSETWDVKTGRYTRQVGWTYQQGC